MPLLSEVGGRDDQDAALSLGPALGNDQVRPRWSFRGRPHRRGARPWRAVRNAKSAASTWCGFRSTCAPATRAASSQRCRTTPLGQFVGEVFGLVVGDHSRQLNPIFTATKGRLVQNQRSQAARKRSLWKPAASLGLHRAFSLFHNSMMARSATPGAMTAPAIQSGASVRALGAAVRFRFWWTPCGHHATNDEGRLAAASL